MTPSPKQPRAGDLTSPVWKSAGQWRTKFTAIPCQGVLLTAFLLSFPVGAAVNEGENLLVNGSFDAEQVAFPEFWTPSSSVKGVLYQRTGGPGGRKPAILLQGEADGATRPSVRQQGLTLVAGETYKLSAFIRTKGFKSRNAGLILHNSGWTSDTGLKNLPADSDWTFREKTFTLFPSRDKEYGVALFASDLTGEIGFADVKLEAISEGARKGSRSQKGLIAAPRLVPFQPLLSRIPRTNPEMVFKLYGILPDKPEACEGFVTLGGDRLPPQTLPIQDGKLRVKLEGLPCGEHTLNITLRHRATHQTVLEVSHPIRIVEVPVCDRSRIKPLNNLVAEVLSEPVKNTPEPQAFNVVNPREGWVFVSFSADPLPSKVTVKVDDRDVVMTPQAGRLEAFRELGMGAHRITVGGSTVAARLVVHSIPEIFDYPPCSNSAVKETACPPGGHHPEWWLPAGRGLAGGQGPRAQVAGQFQRGSGERPRRCTGAHGEDRRPDPAAVRWLHQR